MDHSALLNSARAEFMRSFTESMQRTVPRCIEDFFVKADDTYSSLEQGRFLDARTVLVEQGNGIIQQMTNTMEHLLARSFKTTYSTYRPSANFNTESLTLIDPTAFEGGLRIEEVTSRFRREAEEQLRDLNIRVAILFDQEVTNERENPFRPYLFSRCISSTIENLDVNPNLTDILIERFCDNFLSFVPAIYTTVNNYLAQNGIAAQLQLKIRKSPTPVPNHGEHVTTPPDTEATEDEGDNSAQESHSNPHSSSRSAQSRQAIRPQKPKVSQIEQFFSSAMSRAAKLVGRQEELASTDNGLATTSSDYDDFDASIHPHAGGLDPSNPDSTVANRMDSSSSTFSWARSGEAVGQAIRKFFGQSQVSGALLMSTELQTGEQIKVNNADGYGRSLSAGGAAQVGTIEEHGHQADAKVVNDSAQLQTNASGAFGALNKSIQGFQKTHTPSGPDMFDGSGGLRNLILEQRSALNEQTSNIDEKMTIDIVAMLFEFILRDTQVPAEIRAQLGRLQFLVLKLALKDNTLLTQKGHPARLLVNRIGSISLGLKQVDPSGIEITKEICRIVETLLHDESENPQIFSRMLDELDAFIAKELRASDKKTENAIEGAENARNRTLRFAHTSAQLHEALLGLTIDPYLQTFFETIWVYALELADRDDIKRAHRFRLLVPDLLWSIIPKSNEEERSQLLALLPIILSTLKEGMASIQLHSAQQEGILNWLVDAHTKSMRLNHSATVQKQASLSAIHHHFNNFFVDPDLENFAALNKTESSDVKKFLDNAIKELDIQVQLLDQVYVHELPKESPEEEKKAADNSIDVVMEQLKIGVAVEINLGGEPGQGKLNWVDPALTNLILTLDGQEQPSMVSVRMFRRMIAHGRVKFLETEPLFERAVQSLLKSADAVEAAR
ncbi:DUF1631 family protein [Undibacterium danionis]|uniref:DUF1631 family protein n=1 Tax=Undibacterium danionis TaxID=1812100 RepID=A0ABV6IIS9_9BURK